MTDITDKIAAIPEGPDPLDYGPGFADQADFEECRANRAEAERDLALEVLRKAASRVGTEDGECGVWACCHMPIRFGHADTCWVPDAVAVLAACGKEGT